MTITDEMVQMVANELALARTGGNVYMSGSSNPRVTEIHKARDIVAALDAALRDTPVATETRIAELEAQVTRLQRYGRSWEEDFQETMQGMHDEFVEKTIQLMRDESLQPGDLESAKGDA